MPTPAPHQIEGATFLAQRASALLADDPRVGKTGAAIMACDFVFARRILVVTTATGRPNWAREFREWSAFPRRTQVVYRESEKIAADADVVVIGWQAVAGEKLLEQLCEREWDVIIPDESHYAQTPDAKRTQALYSTLRARATSAHWWPLTGTPMPTGPHNLFPMLAALAPDRLRADPARGWPDVTTYAAFRSRYCVFHVRILDRRPPVMVFSMIEAARGERLKADPEKGWVDVSTYGAFCAHFGYSGGAIRSKPDEFIERVRLHPSKLAYVVLRGKNLDELTARFGDFWLRRTQKDVGIREPIYSLMTVEGKVPPEFDARGDDILSAARSGSTRELEIHMGSLRRMTGEIVAHGVIAAAAEELEAGLDRLVLMCWHQSVIDILAKGLAEHGVVIIDGRTTPQARQHALEDFSKEKARVFIGQMQAAGEAIDLSASCNLWFVEPSFTSKDMRQAALRITNRNQARQCLVRVCTLSGSIYEALMRIVLGRAQTSRDILETKTDER